MRTVHGPHAVRALAKAGRNIKVLHLLSGLKARTEMQQVARARGAEVRFANRAALDALAGSPHHQGVVAEVGEREVCGEDWLEATFAEPRPESLLLALDGIQDPRNLGACVRTAAAVGVDALMLPRSRGAHMTPTAEKVASGGAEMLPIVSVSNLVRRLDWLKAHGLQVVGAEVGSSLQWHDPNYAEPTVLVLGGEGRGLRRLTREACDALVSLPVGRGIHSLNVSVATGVLLYEVLRQRRAEPE